MTTASVILAHQCLAASCGENSPKTDPVKNGKSRLQSAAGNCCLKKSGTQIGLNIVKPNRFLFVPDTVVKSM